MSTMTSKTAIKCCDLKEYMIRMNGLTLEKLYAESAACLAIFRDLPTLSKHYLLRLLFIEPAIPQAVVNSWLTQSAQQEHLAAVEILKALRIWTESPLPSGLVGYCLNDTFRNGLKAALLGGGQPWIAQPAMDRDKYAREPSFLESYAMERWECILHVMVGSQKPESISLETRSTLQKAGLIAYEGGNESSQMITADGFQFLLMDTNSQVWYFILQYLDTMEEKKLNLVECLAFLFQLSFLTLGKAYSTDGVSESLLIFLQNLREFGLIYQRKRKDGRFYPTSLMINLLTSLKDTKNNYQRKGFIVIETNYRIYAYTESPLQIALLALFTHMQYRFPKFCLGILTRESVRQALRSGITADQIINFLNMHAHPVMGQRHPLVPPTISDQVKLWEIERDRFMFTEGVFYGQFLCQSDFELLRNYAKDAGHLVFSNPNKKVMVVTTAGHDDVRRFWKRHKKDH